MQEIRHMAGYLLNTTYNIWLISLDTVMLLNVMVSRGIFCEKYSVAIIVMCLLHPIRPFRTNDKTLVSSLIGSCITSKKYLQRFKWF